MTDNKRCYKCKHYKCQFWYNAISDKVAIDCNFYEEVSEVKEAVK